MSKLLKSLLPLAIVGAVSTSATAADGTINFTGEIIAASCKIAGAPGTGVTGGAGAQVIDVSLGKVSSESLSGTSGSGIVAGKNINLNLDCGQTGTGLTTVKLQFDPSSGTGLDPKKNALLKITGTAEGVGIGLYNSDNKLLDLSANETFDAPLVKTETKPQEGQNPAEYSYSAKLNLRAGFVANGAPIKAGNAVGTLPFTLTYE
ncbi:fimbrial protein [Pseudomonas chlororaphis]|uniref:Fimbrial protein n=1 Tax=Pseudomonas chlororaphis TaxID=587753 RepID=A0A1Q8EJS5_9PSED|nr:fimbrial protein [Pseudomonas chlororaphis]OLF52040.1 fimbrial protein [Pseudomonas chlororaphis]